MAAGDVVNTAARLQAAAPTNSILVDKTTYRATERAIDYREAPAVEAKGKTQPVVGLGSRGGTRPCRRGAVGGVSLVGREQELTLLRETLSRESASASRSS